MQPWYRVANVDEIASPGLLLYVERIQENIDRMIHIAGGAQRLRPHIKTHKLPEVIRAQLDRGIDKFKCATIAEAEMVAGCGAPDVLLAYQPVGPNAQRVCALAKAFPQTHFSVTIDDESAAKDLAAAAQSEGVTIGVLLDIDSGQHRTGIAPGEAARKMYRTIGSLRGLKVEGLHAYDGHIHDRDVKVREAACEKAFAPVAALREELVQAGLPVPRIITGGTPTFPFHASRGRGIECSPGTCVLWDWGYSTNLPDLDFLHAAVVVTRVVSRPTANRLCLDLGHKAIASEMPHPRVHFPDLPDAKAVAHNEEHLVLESESADRFPVGTVLYGIPWHVCPTVALHSEAVAVRNGRGQSRWSITARARRLTI
jgi:D-serine deaminase-like pyridoxal phosphate-dependent protein